jgi:hypothetical protein
MVIELDRLGSVTGLADPVLNPRVLAHASMVFVIAR